MNDRRVLVVVAHPDDEVVFFGGLILRLVSSGASVDVLCVCGEFGTAALTSTRRAEFQRSCWRLGAHGYQLVFSDEHHEITVLGVKEALVNFGCRRQYEYVYTHGAWGEYGHRHHIDVCVATHYAFAQPVYSLAGPLEPVHVIELSASDRLLKKRIAISTYYSQPFAGDWCTPTERFCLLPAKLAAVCAGLATGECFWQPQLEESVSRETLAGAGVSLRGGARIISEVSHIPEALWRGSFELSALRIAKLLGGPASAGR